MPCFFYYKIFKPNFSFVLCFTSTWFYNTIFYKICGKTSSLPARLKAANQLF